MISCYILYYNIIYIWSSDLRLWDENLRRGTNLKCTSPNPRYLQESVESITSLRNPRTNTDNHLLAIGRNVSTFEIYDLNKEQIIGTLGGYYGECSVSTDWNYDTRQLVSGSGGGIARLWVRYYSLGCPIIVLCRVIVYLFGCLVVWLFDHIHIYLGYTML